MNRVAEYGGVQIAGQLQHGFGIFVHRQRGQIKPKQSDRHISQAVLSPPQFVDPGYPDREFAPDGKNDCAKNNAH